MFYPHKYLPFLSQLLVCIQIMICAFLYINKYILSYKYDQLLHLWSRGKRSFTLQHIYYPLERRDNIFYNDL